MEALETLRPKEASQRAALSFLEAYARSSILGAAYTDPSLVFGAEC